MSHEIPHAPPPHVACPAPLGTVHTVHAAPHCVASASAAHALPHLWKPALHAKPQLVPSHVAYPFAGVPHGVHDVPHVSGLALSAHALPHAWYPELHANPHALDAHVA